MNRYLGKLRPLMLVFALAACSNQGLLAPPTHASQPFFQRQISEKYPAVREYLGIPFAKPPIGDLRWRAPQALDSVDQHKNTAQFAPACMQTRGGVEWYEDVAGAFGHGPEVAPEPESVSEDCLYLNVWAPANHKSRPNDELLPIFVWIHGGGNTSGWSYEPNYRGAALANEGIVVVSIAYRLGIFGYFSHPGMAADKQAHIANFGLLDQIAALQWIKENASSFGGDANNITVAGESAGAANIGYLLATPSARNLFARSIHQSGSFELYDEHTLRDVQRAAQTLLPNPQANTASRQLADLRALDAKQLLALADEKYPDAFNYPVADHSLLPTSVLNLYERRNNPPRNMLIGSNDDEWYMYLEPPVTEASIDAWLTDELPGADHARVKALLVPYASDRIRLDKLAGGKIFRCGGYYLAARNTEQQGQSWVYHFSRSREGIGGETLRAYHGAEIPYMFNTHDHWLPTSTEDTRLTNTMMGYWLNFIRSGNPNGDGLPTWPMFSKENKLVQKLDATTESIFAPQAELCEFLMPNKDYSQSD